MFWRGVIGYLPVNVVQGVVGLLTIVEAVLKDQKLWLTDSPDEPTRAASEATLTTRPDLRWAIRVTTGWVMFSTDFRLMSMSLDQ